MISIWWLIPAFFAGTIEGILATAIISGRGDDDEHS